MPTPAHRLASTLAFPVILGTAIGAAIVMSESLGMGAAIVVTQTVAVIVIAIGEHLLPYHQRWNRSHGDLCTDVLHALLSGLGTTRLMQPTSLWIGAVIAAMLAPLIGLPLWPSASPWALQLALALIIAELPQYWIHRWEHEHDLLWRFHATHHSAPRLYWLNAARFHPIDLGLLHLVGYVPLVVLGCPPELILLFGLFDAVFGMLQHSNLDVRLGPLNYIFSMAEPHRWHHSRTLQEANTNYGSNLILWDLVFGTFYLPKDREPPVDIGIAAMPAFPTDYLGQLASPFRWHQVQQEALGTPTAST